MEPKNKSEVLDAIRASHAEMETFLATLTRAELTAPELDAGWSVQDSLAHIAAWETMLLEWIGKSARGETVVRYMPGYIIRDDNRETVMHALNDHFYEQNRSRSLDDVLSDFRLANTKMIETVTTLSEADIFDPQRFAWCNGYPLLGWIAGDTWDHYAEHMGWIKEWLERK